MAFVAIHPHYRDALAREGLATAADFLRLGGVIYCGHPDRNVARLELGLPDQRFAAFLKREHRVPLRDRWANAWAGFGFVSKSCRESVLLQQLTAAGVHCPEVIAVGEDGNRAFLLLREVPEATDLRRRLANCREPGRRSQLATTLGRTLARIHAAGFDHPDLYAKHLLVSECPEEGARLYFLDWQRSQRGPLSWARRCRDLATLDATLADQLASPRERLRCLAAYLKASPGAPPLRRVGWTIGRQSVRLLRKRRIRELRQAPVEHEQQNLIWLDGEALCVTPAFAAELAGHIPVWLRQAAAGTDTVGVNRSVVSLSGGRIGQLTRRNCRRSLAWLGGRLRRERPTSPELAQADLLFRLQRHGVAGPRLLAVGQRQQGSSTQSFLLTETPLGTLRLRDWLPTAAASHRRVALQHSAQLLRHLHDAACELHDAAALAVRVQGEQLTALLATVDDVYRSKDPRSRLAARDLRHLYDNSAGLCRHTEQLRFLLDYLGESRLTAAARGLVRTLLRGQRVAR